MEKLKALREYIRTFDKVAIAFSGGVDSTLLAKVAHEELGDNAVAITIHAEIHADWEIEEAVEFSQKLGIKHIVESLSVLDLAAFVDHPVDRCYHCKKHVFSKIYDIAKNEGISVVFDGSNVDDLSDYRPGLKAIKELKVISPLKEVGLTKEEIREVSRMLDLSTSSKPAFACLATRIPFGEAVTKERLVRIEASERILMAEGFSQFRVRDHGNIARIEVPSHEMVRFMDHDFSQRIVKALKDLGYQFVTLDLTGYSMGSMNQTGGIK